VDAGDLVNDVAEQVAAFHAVIHALEHGGNHTDRKLLFKCIKAAPGGEKSGGEKGFVKLRRLFGAPSGRLPAAFGGVETAQGSGGAVWRATVMREPALMWLAVARSGLAWTYRGTGDQPVVGCTRLSRSGRFRNRGSGRRPRRARRKGF
jgi:hypothetical protein